MFYFPLEFSVLTSTKLPPLLWAAPEWSCGPWCRNLFPDTVSLDHPSSCLIFAVPVVPDASENRSFVLNFQTTVPRPRKDEEQNIFFIPSALFFVDGYIFRAS